MKIAVVRGAFLNQFEMQNFEPLCGRHTLVGFSSLRPIHDKFTFPVIKLPSPVDLPNFPNQRIKMAVLNRIFVDAHYLWGLEEKLQGFDIAHCAETYYYYTQQCLNAKKKGYVKKVVVTVWENIPFNNEGIWGRKKFKKRAIEEVDHFLAVSEGAKEALIKEGCESGKITVVPMGVDLNKFKPKSKIRNNSRAEFISASKSKGILKPFGLAQGGQVQDDINQWSASTILFVGRLEEKKGIVELLEAFRILNQEIKKPNLRLKIVGRGSLRDYIVRRGKEWGISEKMNIEERSYEEMPKVYQGADIFVLPSKPRIKYLRGEPSKYWEEQFGMVLLEAMASGLPVVSTKSGAIPKVVDEAGILVSPGDSKVLYRFLRKLIQDPDLQEELGQKGRQRVEKYFDSQRVAKKIEEVYLSLF